MHKPFSVLIAIYHQENPAYFHEAMDSIWNHQTVKPAEVVLVEDGVLTDALYNAIAIWKAKLQGQLRIVSLKQNQGLGKALNIGLRECSYELVARMDTDDIATVHRFEKQLKVFENSDVGVCGANVDEFDTKMDHIVYRRMVPKLHQNILKYAKHRNPINHPTVMMKKDYVLGVGGYQDMLWFEDYYLWVRLLLAGVVFYNIQEPLVKLRLSITRRNGLKYVRYEYHFLRAILKLQFITPLRFILNMATRFPVRILPQGLMLLAYKMIRK